jgi:hypothetical protein
LQTWRISTSRKSATTGAAEIVIVGEATSVVVTVSLPSYNLILASLHANSQRVDDHDNYSRDRGRGPQRRRNDDGPRRRYEEPSFPKLRRLLLNIASSTKLPQDEAVEIAKLLGENMDDERLVSDFFDIFVQL